MIKSKSIFMALCFVLSMAGRAQTAQWVIKPKYQKMTPFSEALYKVKTYSGMGIINRKGNLLASADSITNMTNGYALALTAANGKYRITAIVSKDGTSTRLSDKSEFYAGDYPFFSEEKCAVHDKKGKYGFINPHGVAVIPCSYVAVHPFREGLASVCKARGGLKSLISAAANVVGSDMKAPPGPSIYIDAKNVPIKFQSEIGKPAIASSFNKGQALVQNDEGKYFTIDPQGKILKIETEVKLEFDDYFSLTTGEKERVNQPYSPRYDSGYRVFVADNRIGIKHHDTVMLPTQFEDATSFVDGYAIVRKDGQYGLIQLINTGLSCNVSESGGSITASATLPSNWDNKVAVIYRIVDGKDRTGFELKGNSGSRMLNFDIASATGKKVYELEADNLILWRSTDKVVEEAKESMPTVAKTNRVKKGNTTRSGGNKTGQKSQQQQQQPQKKKGFVL